MQYGISMTARTPTPAGGSGPEAARAWTTGASADVRVEYPRETQDSPRAAEDVTAYRGCGERIGAQLPHAVSLC